MWRSRPSSLIWAGACTLWLATTGHAQVALSARPDSNSAAPAFDVVSIKPNRNGGSVGSVRPLPGGRFVAENAPIARLIRAAYPGRFAADWCTAMGQRRAFRRGRTSAE
jgi:hypothetical protein